MQTDATVQNNLEARQLTVDNVTVSYVQSGHQGPLVVILPGWGSTKEKWAPVQAGLLSAGFQSICLDLPGFGASQNPPEDWVSKDFAHWLTHFVQKLALPPFVLMGHSFGGKVATLYTVEQAKMVERLFLVASAGLLQPKTVRQKLAGSLAKTGGRVLNHPKLSSFSAPIKKPLYRLAGSYDYYKSNPVMKKVLSRVILEDFTQMFQKVGVPTTVFWGEKDGVTPLWQGKRIHALIPESKLVVVSDGTHTFAYNGQIDFSAYMIKALKER